MNFLVILSPIAKRKFLIPEPVNGAVKYPPFHVLGFHHEHAVLGNNDLVDLGRAVFRGQGDVLHQMVTVFVEEQATGDVNNDLSQLALQPRRTQDD